MCGFIMIDQIQPTKTEDEKRKQVYYIQKNKFNFL